MKLSPEFQKILKGVGWTVLALFILGIIALAVCASMSLLPMQKNSKSNDGGSGPSGESPGPVAAPRSAPQSAAPRSAPQSAAPRSAPQSAAPRSAPQSAAPRSAPQSAAPRSAPQSAAPRSAPQSAAPRSAPQSAAPRSAPQSAAPRSAPQSAAPRSAPVAAAPQSAPVPTLACSTDKPCKTGTCITQADGKDAMCFNCDDEQSFQDQCDFLWTSQMREAAEQVCNFTCGDDVSCTYQASQSDSNIKCCIDGESVTSGTSSDCKAAGEICIYAPSPAPTINSQCIPGPTSEQSFQDQCAEWDAEILKQAQQVTNFTCGDDVSCAYQLENNVQGFECCSDDDCKKRDSTKSSACLIDENVKSSQCIDCQKYNKECMKLWDNDYLMKAAKKRCKKNDGKGKPCYLNPDCPEEPSSWDSCNKHEKDCDKRVQMDDDNGAYYNCYKDKGKCKIDTRAPDNSCDPNINSKYAVPTI